MKNGLKDLQVQQSNGPLILGIDLEGMNENLVDNGVNLLVDRITEIGAVLWDSNKNQPVKILSELIDEDDHLSITQEIIDLTGIDDEMLRDYGAKGPEIKSILKKLKGMMEKADYIMAHNGFQYDLPMLKATFERHETPMPEKVWIDTSADIEFPRTIRGRSMALLEHAHGFVNPFPHRAVTDVLSMLKIASKYSFERMIQMAESEKITIVAQLTAPNWKNKKEVDAFNIEKNKVSKARFRWNPSEKVWSKEIHKILLDEHKIKFDFEWKIK